MIKIELVSLLRKSYNKLMSKTVTITKDSLHVMTHKEIISPNQADELWDALQKSELKPAFSRTKLALIFALISFATSITILLTLLRA